MVSAARQFLSIASFSKDLGRDTRGCVLDECGPQLRRLSFCLRRRFPEAVTINFDYLAWHSEGQDSVPVHGVVADNVAFLSTEKHTISSIGFRKLRYDERVEFSAITGLDSTGRASCRDWFLPTVSAAVCWVAVTDGFG